MKLGNVIFESGKLTNLDHHQQWYFAYHMEETKFGVMDSILIGQIPISTLTPIDDQTPSHLRRFIKTYKKTPGEVKSRLRKAQRLDAQATHKPPRAANQIAAIVLEGDGELSCNTNSMSLVRIRKGKATKLEMSGGKTYRWKKGDTYLFGESRFTDRLSLSEIEQLVKGEKTKAIPPKLSATRKGGTPCSLMAFSIKKAIPLYLEPAFMVSLVAMAMILIFYFFLAPHFPHFPTK